MGAAGFGASISAGAVAIGEVMSIGGPNMEVDDIDVSHLGTTDRFRTFLAGMIDAGEVTCQVRYLKANIVIVYALLGAVDTYTINLPDTSKWVFSGYLKSMGQELEFEGDIEQSLTFKISGKPTWTPVI